MSPADLPQPGSSANAVVTAVSNTTQDIGSFQYPSSNQKRLAFFSGLSGSPTWARTRDLRINRLGVGRPASPHECSLLGVRVSNTSWLFRPQTHRKRPDRPLDIESAHRRFIHEPSRAASPSREHRCLRQSLRTFAYSRRWLTKASSSPVSARCPAVGTLGSPARAACSGCGCSARCRRSSPCRCPAHRRAARSPAACGPRCAVRGP